MTMKHTPGPWRVVDSRPYGVAQDHIREVRGPVNSDKSSILVCELSDVNEREDNARLIASAPELLEALERGAELIGDLLTDRVLHGKQDYKLHKAMIAAIRKAKGE